MTPVLPQGGIACWLGFAGLGQKSTPSEFKILSKIGFGDYSDAFEVQYLDSRLVYVERRNLRQDSEAIRKLSAKERQKLKEIDSATARKVVEDMIQTRRQFGNDWYKQGRFDRLNARELEVSSLI